MQFYQLNRAAHADAVVRKNVTQNTACRGPNSVIKIIGLL